MSVASLNNGSLQLSELVISNEKYSNATGYVASSSNFSAGVTGTSLTVPTISSSIITATDYLVLGTNGGINAVLECTTTNTVQVGNVSGGGPAGNISCSNVTASGTVTGDQLTLVNPTTSTETVIATCTDNNVIQFGDISAGGYGATIGCQNVSVNGTLTLLKQGSTNTVVATCPANNTIQFGDTSTGGYGATIGCQNASVNGTITLIQQGTVNTTTIVGTGSNALKISGSLTLSNGTGTGSLSVSSDGSILYFNGVQIAP